MVSLLRQTEDVAAASLTALITPSLPLSLCLSVFLSIVLTLSLFLSVFLSIALTLSLSLSLSLSLLLCCSWCTTRPCLLKWQDEGEGSSIPHDERPTPARSSDHCRSYLSLSLSLLSFSSLLFLLSLASTVT